MRRFARLMSVIAILVCLAFMIEIINTPEVNAQAESPEEATWAALFYPNTNFENPLRFSSFISFGLSVDFGLLPPFVPDPNADDVAVAPPLVGQPTATPARLFLAGIPADNFSARFSTETPFNAGVYEFTVIADGGVKLIVNENVLIDELGNQGLESFSGIAFIGSGLAEILLDYIDYSGEATVQLTWRDITDEYFATTTGAVTNDVPRATAQVNSAVTGLALRTGPYLGGSLVAVLRPGRDYEIVAQNNIEGSFTWYKLVINEQGQTGWASSRFLDVNLGNITQGNCEVPPSGGLSVAQTIVPGFTNAELAQSCFTNVANVLNQSIGAGLSETQLASVVSSCTAFSLSEVSSFETIVSFVDSAKLVFDIYGLCGDGNCNLTDDLTLEIASLIQSGFTGTTLQATVCFNALAIIFDGQIDNAQITGLVGSCAPLILLPEADPNTGAPANLNATYLNFINSVGGLICQTTSVPTIDVPEESSVFDTLTLLPDTGVTLAPTSTVNIRVRPSTRTAEVANLPWGAQAQVLARTVQGGDNHWYMIRYQGIIGWVDASFANVRGNINDVPIY